MSKILVTGATGFLGSAICRQLEAAREGNEVIKTSLSMGLDMMHIEDTVDFFCDVKPDYVLNCAAFLGGIQFGYLHAAEMFYRNMQMQLSILEACRASGVKRLVNPIGSCAYPGASSIYREDEFWNGKLHESVQAFGMARKAFCVGSWAYSKQYGLDTINLVMSNMYGPGDHFKIERSHAVGALVKKLVDAERNSSPEVVVFGTGQPVREWLYIEDGACAMIKAMDIDPYDEIINVGVGHGISIKDTVDILIQITGYRGRIIYDTSMMDGAACKQVDGSRGQKILDWRPRVDFETGLRNTVNWYIENRELFDESV